MVEYLHEVKLATRVVRCLLNYRNRTKQRYFHSEAPIAKFSQRLIKRQLNLLTRTWISILRKIIRNQRSINDHLSDELLYEVLPHSSNPSSSRLTVSVRVCHAIYRWKSFSLESQRWHQTLTKVTLSNQGIPASDIFLRGFQPGSSSMNSNLQVLGKFVRMNTERSSKFPKELSGDRYAGHGKQFPDRSSTG